MKSANDCSVFLLNFCFPYHRPYINTIHMKPAIFTQCSDFIQRLVSDPLCKFYFLLPVEFDTPEHKTLYLDVIGGRPMDLLTVQGHMKDREYFQNADHWRAEVSLVFENAIKFNKGDFVEGIAQYYQNKLEKFSRSLYNDEVDFAERIALMHAEFLEVLTHPPSECEEQSTCQTVEHIQNGFDEASRRLLADKLNKLTDAATPEVGEIVESESSEIDLGKLKDDKIAELWKLVRRCEA